MFALRDLFVATAVFLSLPMILANPYVGVLVWSWLAYMNPHKLTWGFAHDFPFAQFVAITTLIAILINSKIKKEIPWTRESILLLVFTGWMFFTTFFALNYDAAWHQWDKIWKIQLFSFITMMLIDDRKKVEMLLWVIVASIGLYGIKGGIFTLTTGGAYAVYGPGGTFIGGNNEIGLAMIMVVPWMRYFQLTAPPDKKWIKSLLTAAMILMIIAILGTRSRGALVGVVIMITILFSKNLKNLGFIMLMALVFYAIVQFMPESWHERMGTITVDTEQLDGSALGRLSAWEFAYLVAKDNPLTGGGFECFRGWLFSLYGLGRVHDAHSIYFEVLGEHGFVGLGLFLSLGLFSLLRAGRIKKEAAAIPGLEWMRHLASMMQVSLIGYAGAGAFLGMAYFDLYYALIAILVVTTKLLQQELVKRKKSEVQETLKPKVSLNYPT